MSRTSVSTSKSATVVWAVRELCVECDWNTCLKSGECDLNLQLERTVFIPSWCRASSCSTRYFVFNCGEKRCKEYC